MGDGTSIGRVRGLGSAKHGPQHWLRQRFTAISNLVLTGWLVFSLLLLPNFQFATVHQWLARPVSATALGLLLISVFSHVRFGLQILIEDYVHEKGNHFAAIVAMNLVVFAGIAFGLICVIRIALGGA